MKKERPPIISGKLKQRRYIGEVMVSPTLLRWLANDIQKKYGTKQHVKVKATKIIYENCSTIRISFIEEKETIGLAREHLDDRKVDISIDKGELKVKEKKRGDYVKEKSNT